MAKAATLEASAKRFKFRVLRGRHIERRTPDGKSIVYRPGDVVETDNDLSKHNGEGGRSFWKFLDVTQGEPESLAEENQRLKAELERLLAEPV